MSIDHSDVATLWLVVAQLRLQARNDQAKYAEIDRLLRQCKETGRLPDELRKAMALPLSRDHYETETPK